MSDHDLQRTQKLDEAYAAYLEAEEAGTPLDKHEFAARYPELADELTAHEDFDRLATALRETISLEPQEGAREFPAGAVVGEYRIVEEIGRHGQGVVYKARHLKFEQVVALKISRSESKPTEESLRLFAVEVENQARVDHPNIIPVYGGGDHQGCLFFTMKLIERGDLTRAMAGSPLSPREAARLTSMIARAVHHAHQRQILHRDLKPSNVLLDAEGRPFVSDFGLSTRLGSHRSKDEIVGAPAFMSPEQTRGESTVLSDVYGLGTILYWMLTCRIPFDGRSLGEVLDKVCHQPPTPPHEANPRLNSWRDRNLEAICLKCLEKDPHQRYGSAEVLADDLDRWLRDDLPQHVPVAKSDRLRLWCKRNPVVAGLALTALVTLILVAVAAAALLRAQESALAQTKRDIESHQDPDTDMNQGVRRLLNELDDAELQAALRTKDAQALQQMCIAAVKRMPQGNAVASVFVVGPDKTILADSTPDAIGFSVVNREYARRGFEEGSADDTFLSKEIYRARSDELYKYAIVRRVRDEQGDVLGLLAASVAPESSMAYKRQEDLIGQLELWTGIVLLPPALLLIGSLWWALRRVGGAAKHNSARIANTAGPS
ncbi:MAG: serine/threonine protein kinase [Planctomycetota bacterium]|nr:MAG: serine/threonine protein kinase [Planctomycetota bacterium]